MRGEMTEYEKRARRLVGCAWLSYTILYIGKKTLNHCLPGMIAEGICTEASGGPIGSCFLAAYAAGQFLSGWLGDRVHPRYMIPGGLLLGGLCNMAMSTLSSVPLLMIVWGACGLFCSMLWPPIIRAVSEWTTPEIARSSGAALSVTIPVGTVGCTLLSALALRVASWRLAFFLAGAILVSASVVLYFLLRSLREHMTVREMAPASPEETSSRPRVKIFSLLLLFAAVCIAANGMIKDGLDQWIPTLLGQQFTGSQSLASLISAILPVVNIFGAYAAKWLLSRGQSEMGASGLLFGISAGALGLVLLLIRTGWSGIPAAILAAVLLSVSSAAMLGVNTLLLTYLPLHYGKIGRAAAVSGMLNGFSYAAAAAAATAAGWLDGWEAVFAVFAAAALVGCSAALCGAHLHGKGLPE